MQALIWSRSIGCKKIKSQIKVETLFLKLPAVLVFKIFFDCGNSLVFFFIKTLKNFCDLLAVAVLTGAVSLLNKTIDLLDISFCFIQLIIC